MEILDGANSKKYYDTINDEELRWKVRFIWFKSFATGITYTRCVINLIWPFTFHFKTFCYLVNRTHVLGVTSCEMRYECEISSISCYLTTIKASVSHISTAPSFYSLHSYRSALFALPLYIHDYKYISMQFISLSLCCPSNVLIFRVWRIGPSQMKFA